MGKLYTELYTKDTDTHNCLHQSSSHHKHCKIGGPYGEFLRIKRNYNKIEDYAKKHSEKRISDYMRRGYPRELLIEAHKKARKLDKDKLLNPTNKKPRNKDTNPLVVTFNPANPNVHKLLQRHQHILELYKDKDAFPPKPLIAYRRPKNLSDLLIRAECNNQDEHPTVNP